MTVEGFVSVTHALAQNQNDVDARHKVGHDEIATSGGRRLMRKTIATIFAYAGLIVSFLVAVYWTYWIWQFDWGVSTRGRGLMFLVMTFGAIIVFLVGYFATLYASAAIDGDTLFRSIFPGWSTRHQACAIARIDVWGVGTKRTAAAVVAHPLSGDEQTRLRHRGDAHFLRKAENFNRARERIGADFNFELTKRSAQQGVSGSIRDALRSLDPSTRY